MAYFSIKIELGRTEGSRILSVVNDVLSDILEYYAPSKCDEILIALHELIINSLYELRRSPGQPNRVIQVEIYTMDSHVYTEVLDNGSCIQKSIVEQYIVNTHESESGEEHGRGLAMVKMLSTAFGYYRFYENNIFFAIFTI